MMRVPEFRYVAPKTVAAAAAVLAAEGPAARLLAGGTDLLPNMKRRQQVPSVLVGLKGVGALKQISRGEGLSLGAGLTLSEVAGLDLTDGQRALRIAAGKVATPHIRNMGTLGGNLCLDTRCNYYDQNHDWRAAIGFCKKAPGPQAVAVETPSAEAICWVAPSSPRCWAVSATDTAPALVALGAEVSLVSAQGERRIALADLYNDDGMSYLKKAPGEILTHVHVPALCGWRSTYWKLRRRGSFDFPVLAVAAAVKLDAGGVVLDARLALGAVASYPIPIDASSLVGRELTDEAVATFAKLASRPAKPLDNTDYHLTWRKHMCERYVIGALSELRGDPIEGSMLARTAARLLPRGEARSGG